MSRESQGPHSPTHSSGASNPPPPFPQSILAPLGYHKDVKFLPVPPEYGVQWPPRSIPDPIPVPGLISVPVPGSKSYLTPGDAKSYSTSLSVPLACTEQCQALSILTDEHTNPLIVPDPALVPAPEHAPDLLSRDATQDLLSSPSLAPLPALVRETVPPDHSRSPPKGVALQPMPELVIATCEPLTPPPPSPTASSLPSVPRRHNHESGFCHLSLGR
ncbi:WAS/WASL-interacting protein family member 2-like [Macrobrachium rosenbergii]|uniref:WAS/WASL-interacting protein family member 2-like n=1 Tax=Macrobrachium rosenbergii TaxID=79674 RepID=UPI0034D62865